MFKTLAVAVVMFFAAATFAAEPVKVLIITGDHVSHDWKTTTPFIKDLLTKAGMQVDATQTPAKDLTTDNLAKYDVLLLNYRESKTPPPDTKWTDDNKKAFADAINGGKGLVVYHFASSAFTSGTDWDKQFEQIIAGGWRKQGFHGKRHEYTVKMSDVDHPITKGMPKEFAHANDELYQNSLIPQGATILATAFSDPKKDPKNTGKDEPMLWVSTYGKGRVANEAMGHDVPAMADKGFQTLLIRSTEWASRGDVSYPVPDDLKK